MYSEEFVPLGSVAGIAGLYASKTGRKILIVGLKPQRRIILASEGEEIFTMTREEEGQLRKRILAEINPHFQTGQLGNTTKASNSAVEPLDLIDLQDQNNPSELRRFLKKYKIPEAHVASLKQALDKNQEIERLNRILKSMACSTPNGSFDWHEHADQFRNLLEKPRPLEIPGIPPRHVPQTVLQLEWAFSVGSNNPDEWWILGGSPEEIQRYKTRAERASRMLGYTEDSQRLLAWHTLLKRDSAYFKGEAAFHLVESGKCKFLVAGGINDLCLASAEYCEKLVNIIPSSVKEVDPHHTAELQARPRYKRMCPKTLAIIDQCLREGKTPMQCLRGELRDIDYDPWLEKLQHEFPRDIYKFGDIAESCVPDHGRIFNRFKAYYYRRLNELGLSSKTIRTRSISKTRNQKSPRRRGKKASRAAHRI